MAHYAFLDENNVVTEVIVGKDEGPDVDWEKYYGDFKGQVCKRTSYHTRDGVHLQGGTPFRMNYAGIGYIFREDINPPEGAFLPPEPPQDV
jgi:hypothetical protein